MLDGLLEHLRHFRPRLLGGIAHLRRCRLAFLGADRADFIILRADGIGRCLRGLHQRRAHIAGAHVGIGETLLHQSAKRAGNRLKLGCLGIDAAKQAVERPAATFQRGVKASLGLRQFGGAGAERPCMAVHTGSQCVTIFQRRGGGLVQGRDLTGDCAYCLPEFFHPARQRALNGGEIVTGIGNRIAQCNVGAVQLVQHLHQFTRQFGAQACQCRDRLLRATVQRLAQRHRGLVNRRGQFHLLLADMLNNIIAPVFQCMIDHLADVGQFPRNLGPAIGQHVNQHRPLRFKQFVQLARSTSQCVVQFAAALAQGCMHGAHARCHGGVNVVQARNQRLAQITGTGRHGCIKRLRGRFQQSVHMFGARHQRLVHRKRLLVNLGLKFARACGKYSIQPVRLFG